MASNQKTIQISLPIGCPPAKTFATIIDLPGYNTWLPHSSSFTGTTEISETPMRTGTKYTENGSLGTRYGEVVELNEGERHVVFHQPMKMKPEALGLVIDITVTMTVKDGENGGSILDREVKLQFPAGMRMLVGFITKQFETEVKRTVHTLKEYLEKGEPGHGKHHNA